MNRSFGHGGYDKLIVDKIKALEDVFMDSPADAFDKLQMIISKAKTAISTQTFGTNSTINTIHF